MAGWQFLVVLAWISSLQADVAELRGGRSRAWFYRIAALVLGGFAAWEVFA